MEAVLKRIPLTEDDQIAPFKPLYALVELAGEGFVFFILEYCDYRAKRCQYQINIH
jgi:hypothetical protein